MNNPIKLRRDQFFTAREAWIDKMGLMDQGAYKLPQKIVLEHKPEFLSSIS
jgi:hypothetical protein